MTRLLVDCRLAPCSRNAREAARNSIPYVDVDRVWHDTIASDAILNAGRGARVEIGVHGGDVCGEVFVVVPGPDGWHHADLIVDTEDPAVIEQIKPGVPVSLEARVVKEDADQVSGIRRCRMVKLDAIAILTRGRARYPGAKITSVTEAKPKARQSASGWRSKLPASHRDFATMSDESVYAQTIFTNQHGSIRWDGQQFITVRQRGFRLAA